jgi:hypothetical protein
MENDWIKRKRNRLANYDYSWSGAYFVTVCTKDRRNYFWDNVGATIDRPQDVVLSPCGKIVDEAVLNILNVYVNRKSYFNSCFL